MTSILRMLGCCLALVAACSFSVASAQAQTNDSNVREYLKGIVADENLDYATIEAPSAANITLGGDAYGKNITLKVTSGQAVRNNAVSTEIAVNYPFQEGETIRYSWRMLMPRWSASDAPANRWWLVARWNDQPNVKMGERPEDLLGHNPVMMLGYKQIDKDALYFSYGVPDSLVAENFSFARDQWVKFSVEITWSRSSNTGKAKVFVNDSKLPVSEVKGRNMYGKYYNVFRVGISRSSDIKAESEIQVGDIKVERVAAPLPDAAVKP